MKWEQKHLFLTQTGTILLSVWRCLWVTPLPRSQGHCTHTRPAPGRVLCHLGFPQLPGASQDQKKGQQALALPLQHKGKLANGPDNLSKKTEWESLRELNIQVFFYIHTAPYVRGARLEGMGFHEVFLLILNIRHFPSQELFVKKLLIFFFLFYE